MCVCRACVLAERGAAHHLPILCAAASGRLVLGTETSKAQHCAALLQVRESAGGGTRETGPGGVGRGVYESESRREGATFLGLLRRSHTGPILATC